MEDMKLLAEWKYESAAVKRGYAGQTLHVDLSTSACTAKPVSEDMKEKFVGGRGFGLKLLWDAVRSDTKWDDPENELVIAGGPLCGVTQYPGFGKCYTVFLSPLSEQTYDSNSGGYFGPLLKFAGWDALELQGKADRDVVVYIDGDRGVVQVLESPFGELGVTEITEKLTEHFAQDERQERHVSVVATGVGAENSHWGCLNMSFYDPRRKVVRLKQAGRGGGGTVFRDKRLAALVVKRTGVRGDTNDPADPEALRKVGAKIHKEIQQLDDQQNRMRRVGTNHLTELMNEAHLLPVHNYKFGQHPEGEKIASTVFEKMFTQGLPDGCWYGCSLACSHVVDGYELKTGPHKGRVVTVDGPEYETVAGLGSNIGVFDPEWIVEANYYADHYGIDTISLGTGLAFVCECLEKGYLTKEQTGGLELRFGAKDELMTFIHRLAEGDEFAKLVGQGVHRMKEIFARDYGAPREELEAFGMESQGVEVSEYVSKESIAQWGGYFLTLKGPQHDEAWLIFIDMVARQLPTFEDKAEALHYFPNFRLWFSLVGGCKLPWNDIQPADNKDKYPPNEAAKIPEHVQNYLRLFEAVTGKKLTSDELIRQSERVYNFQRVFQLRMGKGTREHHTIPLRGLGPVFADEWEARPQYYDEVLREAGVDPAEMSTEDKIAALKKHRLATWEKLVDAVYKRRGWNRRGIPTVDTLRDLGIDYPDVVAVVEGA
ncbi:MAG: aldehyde ferredoxin oxidoreductase C-terminal domain-containing protein [Candidatus Bipolaricaulota bacterium]